MEICFDRLQRLLTDKGLEFRLKLCVQFLTKPSCTEVLCLLKELHSDLTVFGKNVLLIVGFTVKRSFRLRVVAQADCHLADAALKAEFVVDSSTGFHPLSSIDGLAANIALLLLRCNERHDCRVLVELRS